MKHRGSKRWYMNVSYPGKACAALSSFGIECWLLGAEVPLTTALLFSDKALSAKTLGAAAAAGLVPQAMMDREKKANAIRWIWSSSGF